MTKPRAEWRGRPLAAALFDLDGTLLDTVGDIALALNRTLADSGLPLLAVAEVRNLVGRGSPVLIERAAELGGRSPDAAAQAAMLERFFHHYEAIEQAGSSATPFPGAAAALGALHAAGVRTAVVTNKYHRFAVSLLERLGFAADLDLVIGGDTCAKRKPDPEPLRLACERLGVAAADSLMVGDSINDVDAARGAGMPVVCVSYGYNEGRDPRTLDCDLLMDSLEELPRLVGLGGPPA